MINTHRLFLVDLRADGDDDEEEEEEEDISSLFFQFCCISEVCLFSSFMI